LTIAGWPVHYDEAQEALNDMADTHRVNYIEAYGTDGALILPSMYRKRLQGALVRIHFTLSHWYIHAKVPTKPANDAFAANISLIRVLVPPAITPMSSPKKRKYNKFDPTAIDFSQKRKAKDTSV
jgi:hypothetical protein